jgi:hypothetical protein
MNASYNKLECAAHPREHLACTEPRPSLSKLGRDLTDPVDCCSAGIGQQGMPVMTVNEASKQSVESPTMTSKLLTREEAMNRLRLKPAHFSKVANGKVKGLSKPACIRIRRRQLFHEQTLDEWIIEVEKFYRAKRLVES